MTRASETSMSNEQRRATAFKLSSRDSWAESYLRARTWLQEKIQEKDKKKTRKEKKNERRRNQYARIRRYKITSTLGLLVRGDPQNEGLRGLQPRALGSKLDYFHAGITSTRLHRLVFQGKHCSGEVEQALAGEATDYFLFWNSVSIFFQQYMCFSSVCCLPWLNFLTRCLQCRLSSKSISCKERHHGWDGTLDLHGCCCRWVLWLFVSWLALLFLAGNSVITWLFALIANSPSSPWP